MTDHDRSFDGGTRTLAGFGLAVVLVVAVFVPLGERAEAASVSLWYLQELLLFVTIAGFTLVLLRRDGIRLRELGLSLRHLLAALVAFGVLYLGLTVAGIALALGFGNPWGLDLLTKTVPARYTALPAPWLLFVAFQFFVGLVEEFAFRGYLQTKVIALLGGDRRRDIAVGILTASLLFGLLHAPGAVLAGASITGVVGVVLSRALTGVLFGGFYEATTNVYFVALLHGLGNTWPLVVDWATWSGPSLVAFFGAVGLVYFLTTIAYRRFTAGTDLAPHLPRTDTQTVSLG